MIRPDHDRVMRQNGFSGFSVATSFSHLAAMDGSVFFRFLFCAVNRLQRREQVAIGFSASGYFLTEATSWQCT